MTATPTWAIDAHGLVKTFGTQRAVDGLDLQVPTGAIYGVLGPNGAGKTTTIRMLATLLPITEGSASIFGHDVASEGHMIRQLIGVTGQYASVDETLTARENLDVFCRLQGYNGKASRAKGNELLESFGLADAATKPVKNFSGGMRRRLDLAASLISQPPLIFLDEPTTGLDPRTRAQMWDTIRDLVSSGSTVLLTTQYLDEADQLADRIAVIDTGRVVAEGTSDELKSLVGASSLHLALHDPFDLGVALRVVGEVVGVEPIVSSNGRQLTVALDDASLVTDVLIRLRDHSVGVAQLAVQKPSLDEVFLTITGHAADATDTIPTEQEAAA